MNLIGNKDKKNNNKALKNNILPIISILFLSFLMIVPHIILKIELEENYFPVLIDNRNLTKYKNYDELVYLSFEKEISETGRITLNDPNTYENRDKPSMHFSQTITFLILGKARSIIPGLFLEQIIPLFLLNMVLFSIIFIIVFLITKD